MRPVKSNLTVKTNSYRWSLRLIDDKVSFMAKVIPREARRITYSSEIRKLKNIPLNTEQKSIILGSLLGDGGIQVAWAGTSKNYRFAKMHSVKQREYIDWTYERLKPFVLSGPWIYEPTQSIRLRTISHPELTDMRQLFYRDDKKVLPKNIAEIISDPLAFAVWFMDDGNLKGHSYNLNTQSFTESENRRIIALLKTIWNLECTLERNNGRFRVYVRTGSGSALASVIRKYILPSMLYKLG